MCRCFGTRPVWLAFPDPSSSMKDRLPHKKQRELGGWLFAKSCDRGALFPEKGLTQWLQRMGFQAVQPGNHIGARAHEVLLGRACSEDARVALLESVCVALVLHTGREMPVEPALAATEAPPRDSVRGGWAQLDEVDLQEELLNRAAMLKSCPHFLWGRMRECFAVALSKNTGRFVPNQSMEIVLFGSEDAAAPTAQHWQPRQGRVVAACCEVPTRRVGTADPPKRTSLVPPRTPEEEAIRRRQTAQSRVQRGQVSRARQALIGASLAPRNSETLDALQNRRPQERISVIPTGGAGFSTTVSIAGGPKVVREVFA